MTEEKHSGSHQLKLSQLTGGALAAMAAAVLGSKLGVAGTITGAGLASVVTTVGTAMYQRSLDRTKKSVDKVRSIAVARAPVPTRMMPRPGPKPGPAAPPPDPGTVTGRLPPPPIRPIAPPAQPARRVGETTIWLRPGEQPTVAGRPSAGSPTTDPTAMFGELPADRPQPVGGPAAPAGNGAPPTGDRSLQPTTSPPGGVPARWWDPRSVDWRSVNWKAVLLGVVVCLVIGVAAVVGYESIAGRSAWGGTPSTAQVFTGGHGRPQQGGPSGNTGGGRSGSTSAVPSLTGTPLPSESPAPESGAPGLTSTPTTPTTPTPRVTSTPVPQPAHTGVPGAR